MATKVKEKEPAAMSIKASAASIVAAMAAKAKPKGGSDTLTAQSSAIEPIIVQWENAKKEEEKWASLRKTCEAQLLMHGRSMRLEACRRVGRVESTISLNGKLKMTAKNQYSKIDMAHADKLREVFGEAFPQYFHVNTDMKLTEKAADDETILTQIIEAIGAENFQAWFDATQHIAVTESFHTDLTLKPAVEALAAPLIQNEIIKPYSPSFKQ